MKYVDEFRKREEAQGLLRKIREISRKEVSIMEICGTHTHSISRYGVREALPPNIRLISGPGCPVCVTSAADVNRLLDFSRSRRDVVIATFGDMMKVPGSSSSLQEEKARGGDIRVVYSPLGALDIAREDTGREVVLFAVGFETTVPTVAATMLAAREEGLRNLSVLSLHKLTPPAMRALMDTGEIEIDGFICPGHVTAIIGAGAYGFLATEYGSPCVVAGFEPIDAIMGIYMLVKQLEEGRKDIEIEYDRVVTWDGNLKAQEVMRKVFEPADSLWRGIGNIPGSGLRIRDEFSDMDAEKRFSIPPGEDAEPRGCKCGSVLKGLITPDACPLFAKACTPEFPIGPCMVSSEGTCAAFFKYRRAA
ncbi:MAG: hydrogenase formation protein HypD [Deltaproteobacteria bacterium]|nr:hydrogenase formation protein HypD [Deltaproteobacteria bacterium]MCL4874603.1 hydrogenase formation protein HypD [bacterium]